MVTLSDSGVDASVELVDLHYQTLIPRPIPRPRQRELGLMIMLGSVSTGPRLRPRPRQMGSTPI